MSATIQDLRKGNPTIVSLRSGRELPLATSQQRPRPNDAEFEPDADSQTLSARKPESDEELLKMFRKVEINIPLLDAIKQIPKYTKFLKELCVHKRKKMKGGVELGGIVSALTRNDDIIARLQQALRKKCRDPRIFCLIVTIQLANRSIVQPLGVLEDVLVQLNELIFPADFYVLDMEDETSRKGSTLILGRLFLMTTQTKIDVHAGMLSMEFSDNLVQFIIFEAMKHPIEDPTLWY
ncbi:hypothetical protein CR513_06977, partial [Mucuna pruriens]